MTHDPTLLACVALALTVAVCAFSYAMGYRRGRTYSRSDILRTACHMSQDHVDAVLDVFRAGRERTRPAPPRATRPTH